jgi:hypothetical protein
VEPCGALPHKCLFIYLCPPPLKVPGIEGQELGHQHIKMFVPRPILAGAPAVLAIVQVEGEPEREARVRSEAIITEILAIAFKDEEFPKQVLFEDGAVSLFERVQQISCLALEYFTWDNRCLHFGVEVSPRATISEIVAAAQGKADEQLEEASRLGLYSGDKLAVPPWKSGSYVLKLKVQTADSIVVKDGGLSLTAAVPVFHPEQWQRIAYESLLSPPLSCVQTGPKEFTAFREDDIRTWRAYFGTLDMDEEHEIRALPHWDNQRLIVNEAFGREMVLDDSRPEAPGRIYVKSADGSPPDPTFARVMRYTLGDDPTEYAVRVHGEDTAESLREGLKRLHPGVSPAKLMFEGAEMSEADSVGDWWSTTGTSPFVVNWTVDKPPQKFWCWFPSGVRDLGSEDLEGRSREEVWQSLQDRNQDLLSFGAYRMFCGQREVQWKDLPQDDLTLS